MYLVKHHTLLVASLTLLVSAFAGCSSAPTKPAAAVFDTSKVDPYAVYLLDGQAYVIADAPAGAPVGEAKTVDVGFNIDAVVQPTDAGGAAMPITVIGPDETCVSEGTSYVAIQLRDRNTGASVAEATAIALAGCGAVGEPALAFPGAHPKARWEAAIFDPNGEVPRQKLRLHTADSGALGRQITFTGVYSFEAGVDVYAADAIDLPATAQFEQDLCQAISGPLAWIQIGDKEIASFARPRTVGMVHVADKSYLVGTEDYGEVVTAYLISGSSATLALEGLLPAFFDLDCGEPAAAPVAKIPAQPLAGTYADVNDFCAARGADLRAKLKCSTKGIEGTTDIAGAGPYKGAALFISKDAYSGFLNLGVQTEKGWYMMAELAPAGSDGSVKELITVEKFGYEEVLPGDPPELVVVYTRQESWTGADPSAGEDVDDKTTTQVTIACGMGASQTPSCLYLPTGFGRHMTLAGTDQVVQSNETKFTTRFENGHLFMEGSTSRLSSEAGRSVEQLLGEHAIEFP